MAIDAYRLQRQRDCVVFQPYVDPAVAARAGQFVSFGFAGEADGNDGDVLVLDGTSDALMQARALERVSRDDSAGEPPDFEVDDGFDV